jgi:hypothetical protein
MGATNPRSRSQSTKLKGKEDRNQGHPRLSFTDFIATKENKEGVASKENIVRVFHFGTGRAQDSLSNQRSPAHGL